MAHFAEEWKFLAPGAAAAGVRALLQHHCRPDPEYACGVISSLYFDTPRLAHYREKAHGDYLKSKVRLRWYDAPRPAPGRSLPVFLELKAKVGSRRRKWRHALTLDGAMVADPTRHAAEFRRLIQDAAQEWEASSEPDLMPALIVAYARQRYVCPASAARVCLDTDIRTTWFAAECLPGLPQGALDAAVLEIKHAQLESVPWLEAMYRFGLRQRSVSKYGLCIQQILGGA
jgi:hypothetical protein